MNLDDLVHTLRSSRGFGHKTDIPAMLSPLGAAAAGRNAAMAVDVGDDCAAWRDGDGYLLFAIEGLVSDFIRTMPWFAGYSAVMVNISDIYAMGGRPTAVVDALWSHGADDAAEVLKGMAAASAAYGVPIVGGHSNARSEQSQLAVAIVGRARKLLSSFAARAGQRLLMAVDLRGAFAEPYPFWNASTGAPGERLRADLELLPVLAEDGLCAAAKDISMAGALGTALMLLECSGVGASIALERIPRPDGVPLERWLTAFPSYGFLLAVDDDDAQAVERRFIDRGIACAQIGAIDDSRVATLTHGSERATLWDLREAGFILPTRLATSIDSPT
ncbi:sll0787 family AIR synthase-like protein [Cupriavidus necator]|uniref:Sll0787 family AIR synthase-like protein n=1 Tax=Cupriavidus necator TaxID=106590 RepID=A0A367PIU9_CUPNE|nr:sll0787 family AIR synthase-like protein [Cupriavidus necator]QQX82754.1 sll0787 family AIR synthase-like protein [Cupriavidus necator]RCJ07504.1 sll0787 family AIR synthase-like protein [Cupriavidus necator]